MSGTVKNIIKKQIVEFHISSNAAAFELQRQVQEWCNQQLLPRLQDSLERYAVTGKMIRIDRLLIEVDHNSANFDEQLVQKVEEALLAQLADRQDEMIDQIITERSGSFLDLLVFYLLNGYLPWWSDIENKFAFESQLHQWIMYTSGETVKQLIPVLQQKQAATRFLQVMPHEDQWLFFKKIYVPDRIAQVQQAVVELKTIVDNYRSVSGEQQPTGFYETLRTAITTNLLEWVISNKRIDPFTVSKIMTAIMLAAGYKKEDIDKILAESRSIDVTFDRVTEGKMQAEQLQSQKLLHPEPAKPEQPATGEKEIYISNAGLVLVARYLGNFFERTGLRQDGEFVHPALAVASLQWMVNGSEEPAEFELALPKILCGMEVQAALPQVKEIPVFIKQEAHELLESLIRHWDVLKNTSVEGLRHSFLQRAGKLSWQKDHWLLQVEQKSYDMLLEHLPWTIGIIKLSFMKDVLYVEWS